MQESAIAELAPPATEAPEPSDIPVTQEPAIWDLPEIQALRPEGMKQEPTAVEATKEIKEEKAPEAPDLKNMSPKARENFAKMEQARKEEREALQAELAKEREERKAEIEAREAKIREYEEALKKPAASPEEIEKRDQEIQALKGEIKYISLERDPDFIARYVTPKQQLSASLKDLAAGSSAPEAFDRAFRMGDQDKLDEIRDSLPRNQQLRWDAMLLQMEQVDIQKDLALKNWSQTAEQIQQERNQKIEETVRQRYNQNLQIARQVAAEPFDKIPALKDDVELKQELNSVLTAVAGGEGADDWNPHKIMQRVAASYVQNKMIQRQNETIHAHTQTIEEQAKKIEELESFVRSKYGSLPNTQVTTETKKTEDERPIWEQVNGASGNGSSGSKFREFI